VSDDEQEILLAARERAIDVLSVSGAEAKRIQNGADAEAVALLLEQQAQAENLLGRQAQSAAMRGLSDAESRTLLESNRAAAELLASAAQEAAVVARETASSAAVDVLMAGQREASTILLEAWTRVTESRPASTDK
jgi:hypothetical protein